MKHTWSRFAAELFADMLTVSLFVLLIAAIYAGIQEKRTGELQFICGLKPVRIVSGSMEPAIKTGAVVLIEKIDGTDAQPGDVITFIRGDRYVTHRLIGIDEAAKGRGEAAYLITKGDHNRIADEARLSPEDVKGRVVAVWNLFSCLSGKI